MKQTASPKIVIVSGRFGGIELGKRLKNVPVDVVLIDNIIIILFSLSFTRSLSELLKQTLWAFPSAGYLPGKIISNSD